MFHSMLYPGIESNKKSSIIEEIAIIIEKLMNYQILDFSICGYMPAALLVPFLNCIFELQIILKNILTTI